MSNIENLTIKVTKVAAIFVVVIGGLITGLTSYYGTKAAIENKINSLDTRLTVLESKIDSKSEKTPVKYNTKEMIASREAKVEDYKKDKIYN